MAVDETVAEGFMDLTEMLYSFFRSARLSQFSEEQALELTGKLLEVTANKQQQ